MRALKFAGGSRRGGIRWWIWNLATESDWSFMKGKRYRRFQMLKVASNTGGGSSHTRAHTNVRARLYFGFQFSKR